MADYGKTGMAETVIDAAGLDRVVHVDAGITNRITAILGDLSLRIGKTSGDGGGLIA